MNKDWTIFLLFSNGERLGLFKRFVLGKILRLISIPYNRINDDYHRQVKINTYRYILENQGVIEKKKKYRLIDLSKNITEPNVKILFRHNSSDLAVFEQVFIHKMYAPIYKIFNALCWQVNYIIDAGAYTGLSSIFFRYQFPNAKIIAVEPDKDNFDLLSRNIELNNIRHTYLEQKAIWSTNTNLSVLTPKNAGQEWGIRVEVVQEDKGIKVQGVTLKQLCQLYDYPRVDILKMNIEGAEHELFRDMKDLKKLLEKIKLIVLEIHQNSPVNIDIPGILKKSNFDVVYHKPFWYALNKNGK